MYRFGNAVLQNQFLHDIVINCFFLNVKHNTFSDIFLSCDIKHFIYSTLG